jgi:hypothetical protein
MSDWASTPTSSIVILKIYVLAETQSARRHDCLSAPFRLILGWRLHSIATLSSGSFTAAAIASVDLYLCAVALVEFAKNAKICVLSERFL